MPVEVGQHNVEIQANASHWRRKPLLQKVYQRFYEAIASELRRDLTGVTVEIGSGIGNLKSVVPDAITTDLFPNPWLDQVENAYELTFSDRSIANLILFDVWHHLQYPGTALAEFHRVLQKQGRLVIFDPAIGLLGRVVYSAFHHEPLGLMQPICWRAPDDFSPEKMSYYAAQGNAQRIFFSKEFAAQLSDWCVVKRKQFAGLSYVGSGGFRGPQLYPQKLHGALRLLDRFADSAPRFFATRLLVVLEKK